MGSRRPDPGLLAGVDAVIHLAGASIAGRFTAEASRCDPRQPDRPDSPAGRTAGPHRPGPRGVRLGFGDRILRIRPRRRDADRGQSTAATDCSPTSSPTGRLRLRPREQAGVRVVRVRTGIVQSPRGGTLRADASVVQRRVGRPARRRPAMAVVDRDRRPGRHLSPRLWDQTLAGPVNAVAPQPVRNSRVHPHPGPRPAPARRVAGAVAGASGVARRAGRTRTRVRQPAGEFRTSSPRSGTGSANPTSIRRCATCSGATA